MEAPSPPLIVLDTSVVVSALVGPPGTPHDLVIDKVASGDVLLALSDDFLRELSRVVGYPDVEPQIVSAARAVRCGLELGVMGNLLPTPRHDWPSIRDPKDGWMLDLAWTVYADYIVTRDPHLIDAKMPLKPRQ